MISDAQRRVLDAVAAEYRATDGWPVTVERVCEVVGLASKSTAHEHLRNLVDLGLIETRDRKGYRPAATIRALEGSTRTT